LFFSVETLMGVARMVVESKAGMHLVIEYLINRLPQVVVFTCPMSMLLAGLLAFGRLSGESELTAMKAAGISFLRIAFPGLVFCLVVSLICLWVNDNVVPRSMKRAFDILIQTQKKDPFQKSLLTSARTMPSTGQEQMLYAQEIHLDIGQMRGVYIHYFAGNFRVREIYAENSTWDGEHWHLLNTRETTYDRGLPSHESATKKEVVLNDEESPPSPQALSTRDFRPEEMSRRELAEKLAALPKLDGGDENAQRKRNRYLVMLYQKLALPWTSLTFGGFAIPLGVRPHRSSRSMGVGLAVLFILIYYVLMTVGMIFGETGAMDARLAAWLPNCIFGFLGLVLLVQTTRR
jgi:lipopolysaccharide export system permease protein